MKAKKLAGEGHSYRLIRAYDGNDTHREKELGFNKKAIVDSYHIWNKILSYLSL